MRFFTSDHHFGHANILKFMADTRQFADTDQMREVLVKNWNAAINPEDEVFVLGDFAYKEYEFQNIMPRLNGRKRLATGNHDPHFKMIVNGDLPAAKKLAQAFGFEDVFLHGLTEIEGIGKVALAHFPYWPTKPEETPSYDLRCEQQRPLRGDHALLLHGHTHSTAIKIKDDNGLMLDIGVDAWGMRPVSEAEIRDLYMRPMVLFSQGLLTKNQTVRNLGLQDYAELIFAMKDAGLPMPRLPDEEIQKMADEFARLWRTS